MLSLITDVLLKPYFDEKLRALKYSEYFDYAGRLLKKADPGKAGKGLAVLAELARNYPYRTQELIDAVCSYLKKRWSKQAPYDEDWNGVLGSGLRILAGFPKKDVNQHPYYVEITQVLIRNLDLKGINFENFVLWGTEFVNANMTRSSFRNTDLGGCLFTEGTSVEWSDFSGALMNFSYMDMECTTFDRARIWGSRFEDARIDRCKMIISDGFDAKDLKDRFGDRLELVA